MKRIRRLIKRQIVIAAVCVMTAITGIAAVAQAAAEPVFNSQKLSLKEGQTKTLKIKNAKKIQIKKTVFKSSKNSVAKVTAKGEVTGVKQGKATITCKLTLKSKKNYTLKCKVTVKSDSKEDVIAEIGDQTQLEISGGEEKTMDTIRLFIGEKELPVRWEDNESVDALKKIAGGHPLRIQMSMYGGFEQVGSLGTDIPRNDVRTTTNAGDIVLYSGNQIVIFYGSNSWAYTRLGKIIDMSVDEISELLGNGDVMITLSE